MDTTKQIKIGNSFGTIPVGSPADLMTKNNVITPQSLAPQPKIELPQTPQPTTPTISPAQNMVSDLMAQYDLSQTEQQAQNFQNQGLEQYLKDIVGLQGETQALAEERQKAGVGTFRQDLQNINSQILKKQAELQQDDIQLISNMRAEERRDTLLPFAQMGQAKLAGDAQIVRALKNAEIGVLNAQALAKQGDIALAQQTAEEAVAVKYAPYKERIASYENILKALQPFLSSAEKKQADKQKLKGDLAMKEIEKAEQKEKDIQKMILDATPNAPVSVIANAKSIADRNGSALEVAQALGQYGGDYLKSVLLKEQIATEKAQRSKIYTDIAKTKSETTGVVGAKPTKPLSGEASKLLSISSGLETDVNNIKAKIDKVGYKNFLRGYLLGTDRETVKLLENAADKIGRLRSGGAINKDEEKRFLRQFASTGDFAFGNADIAKNALDSVLTEAQTVRSGIDPTGSYSQTTIPNKFNQSLGGNQTFPGTSIISNTDKSGNLIFNIPTQ